MISSTRFPNIDQIRKKARDASFMKEDEFQKKKSTMLAEMDALTDTSDTSTSPVTIKKKEVEAKLIEEESTVSEINDVKNAKLNQMSFQNEDINSSYERIYSKIFQDINAINVDVEEKTRLFDIVSMYISRIKGQAEEVRVAKTKTPLSLPDTTVGQILQPAVLMQNDDTKVFRTIPVIVSPSINQSQYIKICSFNAEDANYRNVGIANNDLGAFLAEVIISGNNYAFKGLLTSTLISRKSYGAQFIAEYGINNDLPIAFKVFKSKTTKEIVVAFKFDETNSNYTNILAMDFSINLLVGNSLNDASLSEFFDTTNYTYIGELGLDENPVAGPIVPRDIYSTSILGPNSDDLILYTKPTTLDFKESCICRKDDISLIVFVSDKKIVVYNQNNRYYNTDVFNDIVNKTGLNVYDTVNYGVMIHAVFDNGECVYFVTDKGYVFKYNIFSGNEEIVCVGTPADNKITSILIGAKTTIVDSLLILFGVNGISSYNILTGLWTPMTAQSGINVAYVDGDVFDTCGILSAAVYNGVSKKIAVIMPILSTAHAHIYNFSTGLWTSVIQPSIIPWKMKFDSDGTTIYMIAGNYLVNYNVDTASYTWHNATSGFRSTDSMLSTLSVGTVAFNDIVQNGTKILVTLTDNASGLLKTIEYSTVTKFFTYSPYDLSNFKANRVSCIYDILQNYYIFFGGTFLKTFDSIFGEWQDSIDTSSYVTSKNISSGSTRFCNLEIAPSEFDDANIIATSGNELAVLRDPTNSITRSAASRFGHTSVVIGSNVYVMGGVTVDGISRTCEMYNILTDKWTTIASMFMAKLDHVAVAIGTKIYVIGGWSGLKVLNECEVYDTTTNTWTLNVTTCAYMNVARQGAAGVVVNGKIYVIGGYNGTSRVKTGEVYDPATNVWTQASATFADMNIVRSDHTATVFNGKIYVIGGYDGNAVLNSVDVYDNATNTWSLNACSAVKTARMAHAAIVANGKIYVLGGENSTNIIKSCEVYDLNTNTWSYVSEFNSSKADLASVVYNNVIYILNGRKISSFKPGFEIVERKNTWTQDPAKFAYMDVIRGLFAAVVLNDKIYIMGGKNAYTIFNPPIESSIIYNSCEVYDPATNTWSYVASMPSVRYMHAAVALNGKMYVMGGVNYNFSGNVDYPFYTYANSSCIVYDPATDKWSNIASMNATRADFAAVALNGKIYVCGGMNTGYYISGFTSYQSSCEVYDPATDKWSNIASMNVMRSGISAVVVGGKIYVMAGSGTTTCEVYDPATDKWSYIASISYAVWEYSLISYGNLIILIGGYYVVGNGYTGTGVGRYQTVSIYDTISNTWISDISAISNMITGRTACVAVNINNKIYVMGGGVTSTSLILDSRFCYNNTCECYEELLDFAKLCFPYNSTSRKNILDKSGNTSISTDCEIYNPNSSSNNYTMGKLFWNNLERTGMPFDKPIKASGVLVLDGYPCPISSVLISSDVYKDVLFTLDPFFDVNSLEQSIPSVASLYPGILFKHGSDMFDSVMVSNVTSDYNLYGDNTSLPLGGDPISTAILYKNRYLIVGSMYNCRVATYDLSTETWKKYSDSSDVNMPTNNGVINFGALTAIPSARAITSIVIWTGDNGTDYAIFCGNDGKICSYIMTFPNWIPYNSAGSVSPFLIPPIVDNATITAGGIPKIAIYNNTLIVYATNIAGRVGTMSLSIHNVTKRLYTDVTAMSATSFSINDAVNYGKIQNVITYGSVVIFGDDQGKIFSWDFNASSSWLTAPSATSGIRSNGTPTNSMFISKFEIYDNKLFIFPKDFSYNVCVFDLITQTWITSNYTNLNTLNNPIEGRLDPTLNYCSSVVVLNNKVYVIGGCAWGNVQVASTCEMYDPTTGIWKYVASLNTARRNHCAVALNGKIYVMGGYNSAAAVIATCEVYDPTTNVWTSNVVTFASMNTVRCDFAAVAYNNKIYVIGGFNAATTLVNTCEVYDPTTNVWTQDTTKFAYLSVALGGMSVVVYNDKFYMTGGVMINNGVPVSSFVSYNPATNTWVSSTGMINTRYLHSSIVYNNKLYVMGGTYTAAPGNIGVNSVDIYDFAADKWSMGPNINIARFRNLSYILNSKLYTIGGQDASRSVATFVERLDTINSVDKWVNVGVPPTLRFEGRFESACSVLNNKIYITGGTTVSDASDPTTVTNSCEVYDPVTNSWSVIADMNFPRYKHSQVTYNGKIYVFAGCNATVNTPTCEVYDPVADKWTYITSCPTACRGHTTVVLNNKFYKIGGFTTGAIGVCEVYDPVTTLWTATGALVTVRYDHTSVVIDNTIYTLFGTGALSSIEVFNPGTGTWATESNIIGNAITKSAFGAAVFDGNIYMLGGSNTTIIYDTSDIINIASKRIVSNKAVKDTTAELRTGTPIYFNKLIIIGNIMYNIGGSTIYGPALTHIKSNSIERFKLAIRSIADTNIKNGMLYVTTNSGDIVQYDLSNPTSAVWLNVNGDTADFNNNVMYHDPTVSDTRVNGTIPLTDKIIAFSSDNFSTALIRTADKAIRYRKVDGSYTYDLGKLTNDDKVDHTFQYLNLNLMIGKEVARHVPNFA